MIKEAFYKHRPLFLVSFVYIGTVTGVALGLGAPLKEFMAVVWSFWKLAPGLMFYVAPIMPVFFIRAMLSAHREKAPFRFKEIIDRVVGQMHAFYKNGHLWDGLVALLILVLVQIFFCVGKSLIPHIVPYSWDPAFATIDKALHFGQFPHLYLSPIINTLGVQKPLYFIYEQGWFYVGFVTQGYCIFLDTNQERRMRFMWTILAVWIVIGGVFATILSSVGPVFYHIFYGPVAYYEVVRNLLPRRISYYNALLRLALGNKIVGQYAISAMPSVHVAMVFLHSLYFRTVNRPVFIFSITYFLVVLIGSVYLGWHYAIDGYVACILVFAIWWAAGKALRRFYPRSKKP